MKMKRPYLIAGACLLVLVLVVAIKKCSGSDDLEVETEKVAKRTIFQTVSANGKIQPELEVKISSDVSGEVVELMVKEGETVKKGQILARVNPDIYQSNMERMVAALNSAKANLANSLARLQQTKSRFVNDSINFFRNKKLYDQGAISQAEFENVKTAYETSRGEVNAAFQSVKAAEFNVASSEASLKEAKDNLGKTTIMAPVDGRIIKLNIEKGERVVGTSQMAGTEMMVLASSNEMEVSVEVNESDIVRVSLNDTAWVEVDAYRNRKFKGIVTEIAHSANTIGISADQVTNFVVKVRILQDSYADMNNPFRRGMSATVEIITDRAFDAVSVPIQAVTTRSDSAFKERKKKEEGEETDGGLIVTEDKKSKKEEAAKVQECVFVYENGKAKLVKVKVGIQDDNYIQILEGLKDGDEVISGPYSMVSRIIRDGSRVSKKDSESSGIVIRTN
jgi:HlyD family secretion protein